MQMANNIAALKSSWMVPRNALLTTCRTDRGSLRSRRRLVRSVPTARNRSLYSKRWGSKQFMCRPGRNISISVSKQEFYFEYCREQAYGVGIGASALIMRVQDCSASWHSVSTDQWQTLSLLLRFHLIFVAVQSAAWYVYPIIDWALLVYVVSIVRSFWWACDERSPRWEMETYW